MQLHEQYRPSTWSDIVGQEEAIERINRLRNRGLGGRPIWISGPSGTGKTSIARLIAAEMASDWCIEEQDAKSLTDGWVREIERESRLLGLGAKTGRVYVVNQAHRINRGVVGQLLTTLERIPLDVVWILTTTDEGQHCFAGMDDAPAFLSRCDRIETTVSLRSFACWAKTVARLEGLDSRPVEAYIDLARRCRSNLRAMLHAVEAGEMLGPTCSTSIGANHHAEPGSHG